MSLRHAFFLASLSCVGLLGYALYLQYFQHLDPCPLCLVQRLAVLVVGALFLVGAMHNPGRAGAWLYAALIAFFSLLGAVTAGRHLWLQQLPASAVPDCGPSLEYMIRNWPLADTLRSLLGASGDCARVDWSFLGLSIPAWTLIWFLLLAVWALVAVAVARPKPRRIFLGH